MIRIIVADDHPLVLRGIEGLLEPDQFEVLALCSDGLSAMQQIREQGCDVAVVDLHMPGMTGLDILKAVRAQGSAPKVVILTSDIGDDDLIEAIKNGADGIVLKETAATLLVTCIKSVAAGETWIDREATSRALQRLAAQVAPAATPKLTEREADVARCVAIGLRNKDIAARIGVTEGTVKMHLHNIYEKIGIGSRTELAIYVRDTGMA